MRAAVAIGHKILIAAYRMLSTGTDYKDLGQLSRCAQTAALPPILCDACAISDTTSASSHGPPDHANSLPTAPAAETFSEDMEKTPRARKARILPCSVPCVPLR
jgi:hypothetical protein